MEGIQNSVGDLEYPKRVHPMGGVKILSDFENVGRAFFTYIQGGLERSIGWVFSFKCANNLSIYLIIVTVMFRT